MDDIVYIIVKFEVCTDKNVRINRKIQGINDILTTLDPPIPFIPQFRIQINDTQISFPKYPTYSG